MSGHLSDQQQLVNQLSLADPLSALGVLVVGVVCLLAGWKLFKFIVVFNAAVVGALIGHRLGMELSAGPNLPIVMSLAGALLLGVLAWPAMKVAVSVMAALMGGLVGFVAWDQIATATGHVNLAQHAWAGGLIGLITLGLLAWVIFRFTIMLFTAFEGAFLSVSAVTALLLKHPGMKPKLVEVIQEEHYVLSLIVLVLGVIGLALQYGAAGKKAGKKPPG